MVSMRAVPVIPAFDTTYPILKNMSELSMQRVMGANTPWKYPSLPLLLFLLSSPCCSGSPQYSSSSPHYVVRFCLYLVLITFPNLLNHSPNQRRLHIPGQRCLRNHQIFLVMQESIFTSREAAGHMLV